MTDLTEQWNNGELPEGDYYIKRRNGDFLYDNIDTSGVWRNSIDEDILEVLAPVPSYDEWQESEKYNKHLEEKIKIYERKDKQATETSIAYNELLEENTKLKELLKRVLNATDFRHEIKIASVIDYRVWYNIASEIKQVLGEK